MHHGILGQKWGVRRYQNSDGSLTEEGRKRYADYTSPKKAREKELKKSYKNTRSKLDKLWTEQYNESEALEKKHQKLMDDEMIKRTGMDYWTADEKAWKTNDKKLFNHLIDVDDMYYDMNKKENKELDERYEKKFAETGEEFLDEYFKDHEHITYDEMSKMIKKTYNKEHQMYYDDWSVDLIFDNVDHSTKYEFGFDKDGNAHITRRK